MYSADVTTLATPATSSYHKLPALLSQCSGSDIRPLECSPLPPDPPPSPQPLPRPPLRRNPYPALPLPVRRDCSTCLGRRSTDSATDYHPPRLHCTGHWHCTAHCTGAAPDVTGAAPDVTGAAPGSHQRRRRYRISSDIQSSDSMVCCSQSAFSFRWKTESLHFYR